MRNSDQKTQFSLFVVTLIVSACSGGGQRTHASVLLGEVDRENRVRQAWLKADKTTRPMFENERLFRDMQFR